MTETRSSDTYPDETHCAYPGCINPPRPPSISGPRPKHCKDHTRLQALRERKRLAELAESERRSQEPERPVAEGVAALAALVKRHEQLVVEMAQVVDIVNDPAALAREIAEIQRAAGARVAAAEAARDAAERDAAQARDDRDEAIGLRDEAVATASEMEQSVAEAEQSKADAKEAVHEARDALREMRKERDTARDAQVRAETERDDARTEAARARGDLDRIQAAMENQRLSHQAKVDDLHARHAKVLSDLAGGSESRRSNGRLSRDAT